MPLADRSGLQIRPAALTDKVNSAYLKVVRPRPIPALARLQRFGRLGRAPQLSPATSDLDLLGDFNGIVNIDAEMANGALDLRVTEEQLDSAQISGAPVNQRRLGSTQ